MKIAIMAYVTKDILDFLLVTEGAIGGFLRPLGKINKIVPIAINKTMNSFLTLKFLAVN